MPDLHQWQSRPRRIDGQSVASEQNLPDGKEESAPFARKLPVYLDGDESDKTEQ